MVGYKLEESVGAEAMSVIMYPQYQSRKVRDVKLCGERR